MDERINHVEGTGRLWLDYFSLKDFSTYRDTEYPTPTAIANAIKKNEDNKNNISCCFNYDVNMWQKTRYALR